MRPMPESSPPARSKRAVREHPLAAFLLTAPPAWRVTTFRVLAGAVLAAGATYQWLRSRSARQT